MARNNKNGSSDETCICEKGNLSSAKANCRWKEVKFIGEISSEWVKSGYVGSMATTSSNFRWRCRRSHGRNWQPQQQQQHTSNCHPWLGERNRWKEQNERAKRTNEWMELCTGDTMWHVLSARTRFSFRKIRDWFHSWINARISLVFQSRE